MDLPLPIGFLGNAQCACVKLFKYFLNGLAQVFAGITRVDTCPVFPGLFDEGLKMVHEAPGFSQLLGVDCDWGRL
jgi:hypothetical protein